MKTCPYQSAKHYLHWLSVYTFENQTCEEIAIQNILFLLNGKQEDPIVADCGAGPGRIWHAILPHVSKILAVEPNRAMWCVDPPVNVQYIQEDGLTFMINYKEKLDVITFLWSINYPLFAALFESVDGAYDCGQIPPHSTRKKTNASFVPSSRIPAQSDWKQMLHSEGS
jgi:hypothetical protein